ncbi:MULTISPECIES: hypothetical protein [Bacillaceae]|uniref:hypothetical protein n=1 Tax=Bacillaceae TaxID=186817 RepID=UPI001E3FB935|nr:MULTISPECIES: hypothetical protein [Bacillaceae]MCE4047390.1 hypothetical protein [Bacillus sp. Au-Bac7]MCM3030669.1 hypothetical protein [Niallia sp. MER 6]MDL0435917.1 hypothetical protein [Niallia sp. SS-2023]UPO86254.1 hypothetical protein L8T27_011575 [Niallia sp. Man26]
MTSDELYQEFLYIGKALNKNLGITPVLYGSLGLEVVTGINFNPQDIDILVPISYIEEKWPLLKEMMEKLSYELTDLHEHKFEKNGFEIGFAYEEDLPHFAGVAYNLLEMKVEAEARFKVLSVKDFLAVYRKSSKDSYRKTKNNNKDLKKIAILECL